MEYKDKVDLLHKTADTMDKQSNVLYKKIFILIALLGGLGTLIFKVIIPIYIKFFIIIIIFIVSTGVFFIYLKLSKINSKIDKIIEQLERLENE